MIMQNAKKLWTTAITLTLIATANGCDPNKADDASDAGVVTEAKAAETDPAPVVVGNGDHRTSKSGYDLTPLPRERIAELAAKLSPQSYKITQKSGTEPSFCGGFLDNKKKGLYACVVCGLPLFSSENKFDSGTGWPSFDREFDPDHVSQHKDMSLGIERTEITCARCGAHLGHVFDDGPTSTGQRHCLNSASLVFVDPVTGEQERSTDETVEIAYFAGGCFWGMEYYLEQGPGVLDVISGYMQGRDPQPGTDKVDYEKLGHAETVKVVFDPTLITYERLLEAFFDMHDPTQLNRQGPDFGTEYRSGIWYVGESQRIAAEAYKTKLQSDPRYAGREIVTQIEAAKTFYPARDFHQNYIVRTGRACHHADPWQIPPEPTSSVEKSAD